MEETKLEKLARLSGKATSKALDALGKRGFDIRGKLSVPISRVPRRAPSEKPKSSDPATIYNWRRLDDRITPDKQKSVCPTGWECHAVRAPGVNVTTEPPRRDGDSAVITGSWNTRPVKVSAAPRLVLRAPARMTPAFTGMTVLLPVTTASRPPK
jgi:hypothetical protein